SCPRSECRKINVDTAVLVGTGLQSSRGNQRHTSAMKPERYALTVRSKTLSGAFAKQSRDFVCGLACGRPACHRPPRIQLSDALQLRPSNHDRSAAVQI